MWSNPVIRRLDKIALRYNLIQRWLARTPFNLAKIVFSIFLLLYQVNELSM